MRCLYCGKELALLKRLTKGGEFCSEAHKQSYQEEYNRLALSRLLQAQKKGQQGATAAPPPAPAQAASIAVEEPVPAPESEHEQPVALDQELEQEPAQAPEVEEAVAQSQSEAETPAAIETLEEAEPEPQEISGFLLEGPAVSVLEEPVPYQESWLEVAAAPVVAAGTFQGGPGLNLSSADLLSLPLAAQASDWQAQAAALDPSPQPWPEGLPARTPPPNAQAKARRAAGTNRLPAQGALAFETAVCTVDAAADLRLVQGVDFEVSIAVGYSPLLDLWTTAIDFPAEDAEVSPIASLIASPMASEGVEETALELVHSKQEELTPHASLEALSRLHQELKEEFAAEELAANEAQAAPPLELEVVAAPEPEPELEPEVEPEPAAPMTLEITAEVSSKPAPAAKFATELIEIEIRTFPPAKAVLATGEALMHQTEPLLPNLKSLPLRPKVALAPEYGRSKAPAATTVRTPAPAKPAPGVKPAAPAGKAAAPSKPAAPAAKPASPGAAKTASGTVKPAPQKPEAVKPEAVKQEAAKPAAKAPANTAKVASEPVNEQVKEPVKEPVKESVREPVKESVKESAKDTPIEDVPSFEIAQPPAAGWLGSLKLKLGIAILLLLICCVYFLGWGRGKSHLPPVSSGGDGSGPSIILGEGGWVEGWGGDPNGLHVGRQITIYRPSLKLSDYRLEFEASIDVRSVGWVFRASDPQNYYAMKLMTVSNGLSPKVALFKYLVANGRQTQVGRVPIDLAVRPDTMYDIRVDVRGPQFTTSIQGQQVDSWTDDQLKIGGAGFLNEREERSKVKSVSIRYLNGPSK